MRKHIWILAVLSALTIFGIASAQEECRDVLDLALNALDANCTGTERNSACYGYNNVRAEFFSALPDDAFDLPADIVPVPEIARMQTLPYDPVTETWGVALMNVQANLPNTFPGQGVVFVLMGATSVENAVDPAEAVVPVDPVDVTTTARVNLRSGPSQRNNVLLVADAGQTLPADALSEDGTWVRVEIEGRQAWVSREFITGDVNGLPTLDEDAFTPMQAFYLTTGVGEVGCTDAPDALLVQGPQNVEISLSINEMNIRLGSTVLFRTNGEQQMGDGSVLPAELEITVIEGQAETDDFIIPQGFTATIGLDGVELDNGLLLPAVQENFQGCEALSEADAAQIDALTNLPDGVLNYPVEQPSIPTAFCGTRADVAAQQAEQFAASCGNFRPTSPLGGMAFSQQAFYWDPANNAARYRVNVFNFDTGASASFLTSGSETTLTAELSNLGTGFNVGWNVEALDAAGNVVCTSEQVTMAREAATRQPIVICTNESQPCSFYCPGGFQSAADYTSPCASTGNAQTCTCP